MKKKYDIIVIGGGPGGSIAAYYAALGGVDVLLLEKNSEIGSPVRCAEGISRKSLREFVEPDPHWTAMDVKMVKFIAPNGGYVTLNTYEVGYVLDRHIFDMKLAQMAAEAGAEILTKACAIGMDISNGTPKEIIFEHLGDTVSVESDIFIGADGVESRVGRWSKLNTVNRLEEIVSCAQYTIFSPRIDHECCQFYFGKNVAPGGYAWVFPKMKGTANVGLGISGDIVCGGVPVGATMKRIVSDGVMLVGDAAHQANPLTGGGIATAMKAGRIAGRVAAQAIREGDVSSKRLEEYSKEWNELLGDKHIKCFRLKKAVNQISDDEFNRLANVLQSVPVQEMSLQKIFMTALKKDPKLLIDVAKVFL